ncbi:helicase-associated domain-containing protein [Curtobacterium sp. DN_7.5]|uniref:helicase-associated domain-containing protein n=1 Tax=Curtobacterium sp. DN_7.5 TaxID=3049047 RepID=UPI001F587C93|nr:helicase-associated domain-containing protein [Curtobacterium sp. DN_7.5]
MTTTADLAARLRAMPDDALERLVVARRLPAAALAESGPQHVADFFDLAEALRTDDAVDAAIEHLPRAALLALRDGGDPAALAPAVELGLADADGGVDDAVTDRLAAHPDVVDAADRPGGTPPARPAAPVDDDTARATGAEHAFSTMTVLAELLHAVDAGEVRELVKGGIGTPLAKTLGERLGTAPEVVSDRLALLRRTGLASLDQGTWSVSGPGHAWLVAPWPDRWTTMVAAWRASLDPAVGEVLELAGPDWHDLVATGRWAYPAGARWLDAELLTVAGTGAVLGLAVDGVLTTTGAALLAGGADAGARAAADLPDTVPGVYLQHDLTVIAPGPLAPADDAELRAVATLEAPGLAARYRISEESLARAFRAGLDRDAVLGSLERLSVSGVPQPLAYLVDQVAERDGSIVVDLGVGGVGSVVRGTADQLDLIGVDAELRQMSWDRPDLTTLTTRYPAQVVHTALRDARYPAVLTTAAQATVAAAPPVRRAAGRDPRDAARALVERLRLTTERAEGEPEQEWLGRQIDLAVRGRTPIRLTVRMPDGTERPFSIVPTSVAAGRVRGKDTTVDVERTLPLSLVVAVESDA